MALVSLMVPPSTPIASAVGRMTRSTLRRRASPVKLLQRSDCEKLLVAAEAEEPEGPIEEIADVKCMVILRRAVRIGELQMALQQPADVPGPWIINRDLGLHIRSETQ
jgi:hypothetical protein